MSPKGPPFIFSYFAKEWMLKNSRKHNSEVHGGRCKRRKDFEGNTIRRTPPYPPSHCHWILPIETQYPNEALKVLEKLDIAERIPGTKFALRPKRELK